MQTNLAAWLITLVAQNLVSGTAMSRKNWLMKNTVDITYKAGLKPGNPYFRLYEYKSK